MPTELLTGARYPDLNYATNPPQDIQNAVNDLANKTVPRFATTSARDTAYANWTAAGNALADGMMCHTDDAGGGLWMRRDGAWTLISPNSGGGHQSGTFALFAGYEAFPNYYPPGWRLTSSGQVLLRGMVRRNGASFAIANNQDYYFATVPAAIRPTSNVVQTSIIGLASTAIPYPVRLWVAANGTQLGFYSMEGTGTGTLTQNAGYIALDGCGWFL